MIKKYIEQIVNERISDIPLNPYLFHKFADIECRKAFGIV